ncbi:TetR/AcrR family transcriptional regulator [Streptomyces sp. CB01201]|uniref:TetR/AcrR family transcriptional regulator n=1 Tax=Streptomyces sp. CB01201 TaxID=2020324 RepID=UPI00131AEA5F|nr:TetR/AcrR family transcriptional regulator [Streptomyces sp. CB01201]
MTDSLTSSQALPGRRERNKQRVRNHLYASAIKLITVKGYEHTSVDEIAEEADVARGTFFNHFQRKEDLITMWGARRRVRLKHGLETTEADPPECLQSMLERCVDVLCEINEEERDVTRAMLMAWVKAGRPLQEEPFASEIFANMIGLAQKRGEIPEGVDSLRVGLLLRDAYLGTLYRWSQDQDGERDLRTELNAVCAITLHGIKPRSQERCPAQ